MVVRILLAIVVVIAAVLVYAAMKPNTFRIQRSITIDAPANRVFPLINDLHNWAIWEPDDRKDASMTQSFSGTPSGVGAIRDWNAKSSAGKGRMTIVESVPDQKVRIAADWERPFKALNMNEFVLTPAGSGTQVTWSMEGPNIYMLKLMSVFVNMDKMMGKHFEDGLAGLKSAAEKK
jgi:uncharacterized protein YndB with AHSA1/START domain